LAPGFSSYQWISTANGPTGAGKLPVGPTGQETNGSFAQTPAFTVNPGDSLSFYFNYITSDGSQFTDYAWAGLFLGSRFDSYLFTARTTPSGDTVPGYGLPGLRIGVTLTPPSTPIIPGGPAFSPLEGSSERCYAEEGCGYTGWIKMDYTFTTSGTYSIGFGVTNLFDSQFDSAFAFAGVSINQVPIDEKPPVQVHEPTSIALMALALVALGGTRRRRKPA
jgi:hypothetical protein